MAWHIHTRAQHAILRRLWRPRPRSKSLQYCSGWTMLNDIVNNQEQYEQQNIVSSAAWLFYKTHYNIACVNSERWLAKSRVDITQCQHGNVGKFLSLCFFVLYYKTNIKHFFSIDIQLYQHSWKLGELEIVWKHSALRVSCFHTISRFPNFHKCWYWTVYQHGKCFIFVN
jgi:hypothetical protein